MALIKPGLLPHMHTGHPRTDHRPRLRLSALSHSAVLHTEPALGRLLKERKNVKSAFPTDPESFGCKTEPLSHFRDGAASRSYVTNYYTVIT